MRANAARSRSRIGGTYMDKKIAGLVGAVAALTSIDAAQAATQGTPAPAEPLRAASYSDLLTPIANAVAVLEADDQARSQGPAGESADKVEVAQIFYHHHHHHHHYHHRYIIRRYHHHHHHHHHYRRYYHHHHHHHHSQYMASPRRDA